MLDLFPIMNWFFLFLKVTSAPSEELHAFSDLSSISNEQPGKKVRVSFAPRKVYCMGVFIHSFLITEAGRGR